MFRRVGRFVAVGSLMVGTSLTPDVARASSVTGVVKNVTIKGANYAVVMTAIPPSGRPGCHNGGTYEYAFDISTSKGRALLSTAQAALLSGKTATIIGGSSCTTVATGSAVETVQTISLGSIFDP
jgi:hypothetical protein